MMEKTTLKALILMTERKLKEFEKRDDKEIVHANSEDDYNFTVKDIKNELKNRLKTLETSLEILERSGLDEI